MKNALINAFMEIIAKLNYPETDVLIQLPKNPEHGDFSTNLAMQLGGNWAVAHGTLHRNSQIS